MNDISVSQSNMFAVYSKARKQQILKSIYSECFQITPSWQTKLGDIVWTGSNTHLKESF